MHALRDGIARVLAAPAILIGVIAAVLLFGPPLDGLQRSLGAFLLAAFLAGGVLDRYARRRATRASGFFAACGAHLGAIVRTWLIVFVVLLLFHAAVGDRFENAYIHETGFVLALLLGVIVTFAQVRIAVEDRRSAIGALLAGGRFAWRNPAGAVLVLFVSGVELLSTIAYERLLAQSAPGEWGSRLLTAGWIAAETFCVLVSFAAATSLFQARLAHAGYTAAPPRLWPESPAAEAIGHAAPTITP